MGTGHIRDPGKLWKGCILHILKGRGGSSVIKHCLQRECHLSAVFLFTMLFFYQRIIPSNHFWMCKKKKKCFCLTCKWEFQGRTVFGAEEETWNAQIKNLLKITNLKCFLFSSTLLLSLLSAFLSCKIGFTAVFVVRWHLCFSWAR